MDTTTFDAMIGKTMVRVEGKVKDDTLLFVAKDGPKYLFYHDQSCCEMVRIDDIVGDLKDLVGAPILTAEETTDGYNVEPLNVESYTWTFYTFTTRKGTVTVKWLGESNGYYSESVDFRVINPDDENQCGV